MATAWRMESLPLSMVGRASIENIHPDSNVFAGRFGSTGGAIVRLGSGAVAKCSTARHHFRRAETVSIGRRNVTDVTIPGQARRSVSQRLGALAAALQDTFQD